MNSRITVFEGKEFEIMGVMLVAIALSPVFISVAKLMEHKNRA